MLTMQEIEKCPVSLAVAREALIQADKRLVDTLEIKKGFEQKATTFLNAYLAITLALLTVAGALAKDATWGLSPFPFVVTAAAYLVGAVVLAWSQWDDDYGVLGSAPYVWLREEVLTQTDAGLAVQIAYIVRQHHDRIELSETANARKCWKVRAGIGVGVAAPFALFMLLLTPLGWARSLGFV